MRVIDTSDVALIEAVKAAGGRVFIGLKEPATAKLQDATFQRVGGRRARISAMSATAAEAARISLHLIADRVIGDCHGYANGDPKGVGQGFRPCLHHYVKRRRSEEVPPVSGRAPELKRGTCGRTILRWKVWITIQQSAEEPSIGRWHRGGGPYRALRFLTRDMNRQ